MIRCSQEYKSNKRNNESYFVKNTPDLYFASSCVRQCKAASLYSSCFYKSNNYHHSPLQEKSFIISSDFMLSHHILNRLTVFTMSELCNRRIQIQLQFKIQLCSVILQPMTAIQWSHYHCQLGMHFEIPQLMKFYYKGKIFAPGSVHKIMISKALRVSLDQP